VVGSYKMLALLIICQLVPSGMWSGLTALMVKALRIDSHLNNGGGGTPCSVEERISMVDKTACELEDCAHSSCKSAKKGAQRSQKAGPWNPQDEKWGLYWVPKETERVEMGENKD
jgi:hypothetical protein